MGAADQCAPGTAAEFMGRGDLSGYAPCHALGAGVVWCADLSGLCPAADGGARTSGFQSAAACGAGGEFFPVYPAERGAVWLSQSGSPVAVGFAGGALSCEGAGFLRFSVSGLLFQRLFPHFSVDVFVFVRILSLSAFSEGAALAASGPKTCAAAHGNGAKEPCGVPDSPACVLFGQYGVHGGILKRCNIKNSI